MVSNSGIKQGSQTVLPKNGLKGWSHIMVSLTWFQRMVSKNGPRQLFQKMGSTDGFKTMFEAVEYRPSYRNCLGPPPVFHNRPLKAAALRSVREPYVSLALRMPEISTALTGSGKDKAAMETLSGFVGELRSFGKVPKRMGIQHHPAVSTLLKVGSKRRPDAICRATAEAIYGTHLGTKYGHHRDIRLRHKERKLTAKASLVFVFSQPVH